MYVRQLLIFSLWAVWGVVKTEARLRSYVRGHAILSAGGLGGVLTEYQARGGVSAHASALIPHSLVM